jgi:23S rRNA (pseudouridine1915-N3)-methyltransferase
MHTLEGLKMKINLFVFGKIKETYLSDAIKDYLKRLNHYRPVKIIEINDLKEPKNASFSDIDNLKEKEATFFFDKYKEGPIIALDESGKMFSSIEFSETINQFENRGPSTLNFVIGGSNGLGDSIKKKSDLMISFSKMTFPHGLMRLYFLEQLYRAYKILNHETYHK